jgi:hypothetical protein
MQKTQENQQIIPELGSDYKYKATKLIHQNQSHSCTTNEQVQLEIKNTASFIQQPKN